MAEERQLKLRYLALGDSYTIGEGVEEKQRWPMQLVRHLESEGISMAEPRIIAKSGWTTDELQLAIDESKPESNYDLVTLLIGVNNQYRGRDVESYRKEMKSLVEQAIDFAGGRAERVIVVSIPDYGVTPFIAAKPDRRPRQIAEQLDQYNSVGKKLAERLNTQWVDITPLSRAKGMQPQMLVDDALHPSGEMYAEWTQLILPIAKRSLTSAETDHKPD